MTREQTSREEDFMMELFMDERSEWESIGDYTSSGLPLGAEVVQYSKGLG